MPPRRSVRVAAVAERASSALSPLPLSLVLHIFSLLPVDARACAACVSRGWYATLLERSLWTRLNLSPSSGVRVRVTDAVLAGAATKARGQLTALDVLDCGDVVFEAVLAVVQVNGGALRELRVGARGPQAAPQILILNTDRVERMLLAAPQLTAFHADVRDGVDAGVSVAHARRMLRNEAPFQPLRVRTLLVAFPVDADEASALALAADLAAHASLKRVRLENAPLHSLLALDAVVDAALALQMQAVNFCGCRISPASAPALARLLGGGALTELVATQNNQQLLDGPSATLLGAALRANSTLTSLYLLSTDFWRDADAAAALLSALTGHSSLRTLCCLANHVAAADVTAGAALGALVAANAPVLTELNVSYNSLGDEGLRPLVNALPANTHLRTLNVVGGNDMSAAFARDVLLPAVRANTSLRSLGASFGHGNDLSVREAEALVAARAAAA